MLVLKEERKRQRKNKQPKKQPGTKTDLSLATSVFVTIFKYNSAYMLTCMYATFYATAYIKTPRCVQELVQYWNIQQGNVHSTPALFKLMCNNSSTLTFGTYSTLNCGTPQSLVCLTALHILSVFCQPFVKWIVYAANAYLLDIFMVVMFLYLCNLFTL